ENYQLPFAQLPIPDQDLLSHPSSGFVRRLQLHPGFGYALFVEGLRQEVVQGQAATQLRDGAFKRLCREAAARPQLSWCLILDDIHRCPVQDLFGETQQLLERLPERVWLPASGDALLLPPRLRLIATAQLKALPSLDPVWLRHFAVVELAPQPELLPDLKLADGRFAPSAFLTELNARLQQLIGPAAAGELLGHGYFFQHTSPPLDFGTWRQQLHYRVWPRLRQLSANRGFELSELLGALDPGAESEAYLLQALRAEFPMAFKAD
ncbi:MAG: hypothetical protein CVV27_00980, partial [Candidatus Melainabacteria bacterium HGW-Melainabacteria-1]